MREEVEGILAGVLDVDGVDGVLAINADGDLLGSLMPGIYDEEMLSEASGTIITVVQTLRELKIRADDLAFDYPGVSLVVRDLRHGYLVLLSQATISMSLLKIATNVACKKLTKLIAPQSTAKSKKREKVAAARRAASETSTAAASTPPPAPPVAPTGNASSSWGGQARSSSVATPGASSVGSGGAFNALPAQCVVFSSLIGTLFAKVADEKPDAIPGLVEALTAAASKEKLSAPGMAAIRDFAASSGEKPIMAPLSEKEMSGIVHSIYVHLCDAVGPIDGDQMMTAALKATRGLPESREYSPYELL